MKYLVVEFYDNDFGCPMRAALERLWGWINTNNAHLAGHKDYLTIPQIYQKLLDSRALQSMIQRLFVLENLCYSVEHCTRGLYRGKGGGVIDPNYLEPNTYLHCEVSLYEKREDIPDLEWANGECVFLELETGIVGVF